MPGHHLLRSLSWLLNWRDGNSPRRQFSVFVGTLVAVLPIGACNYAGAEYSLPLEFVVEANLTIGGAEEGPESFSVIHALAIDDKGRIFVSDAGEREIRLFDSKGVFVRSYGRRGRGPGEFFEPNGIALSQAGELFVYDPQQRRLSVFDTAGTVSRTHYVPITSYGPLWEGGIDSLGRLLHRQYVPDSDSTNVVLVRRLDFTTGDTASYLLPTCGIPDQPMWRFPRGVVGIPFAPERLIWVEPDAGTWCAQTSQAVAYLVPFGDSIPADSIASVARPKLLSRTERDSALALVRRQLVNIGGPADMDFGQMPTHRPLLNGLARDDEGRMWMRLLDQDGVVFHVFAPDGRWLARVRPGVRLVNRPLYTIVKQRHLYIIGLDSNDVPTVYRFPVPKLGLWSSQHLVDSAPPSLMRGLELLGAHAPQMAVAPSGVVEVSDVRRDVRKGELSARIDVLLDALLLL